MPKRNQEGRGGHRNSNAYKRRNSGTPPNERFPDDILTTTNAHPTMDLEKLEKTNAREHHEKPKDLREQLVNELHGVSTRAVPESPEMISSALESFQLAIDNSVPESEKSAYHKARVLNSTYVESAAFRLKFLRAELFDPKKAALRFARNLNYLLEEFGEFALMRQLYLSDLNKEETKFLKKGYIQLLPFRDNVGRRVVVNLGSYGGFDFSHKTKERVGAYLHFAILSEDVTSQRLGAVAVGCLNEDAIDCIQPVELSSLVRFQQALPIRFTGYHTCVPDSFRSRIFRALALTFFHGEMRFLSRIHIGTQVECDYKLRTFGIPTEWIPRSCTGTIKDVYHKNLLKMRSKIDEHRKAQADGDYCRYYSPGFAIDPFPAIGCPEVDSFLVRRNGVAWNFPGNVRVRSYLEEKLNNYKRLKGEYVTSITEEIIAMNIPILIFDDLHCWYTRVTKKEDIQKQVLYIMREIRKRRRIKEKYSSQLNECSTATFQDLSDGQCSVIRPCYIRSNGVQSMDVETLNPMNLDKHQE